MLTAEWTSEDADEATAEGWCISQCGDVTHPPYELQRIDEDGIFPGDVEAWEHVIREARRHSALHMRALVFLHAHSIYEWAWIMYDVSKYDEAGHMDRLALGLLAAFPRRILAFTDESHTPIPETAVCSHCVGGDDLLTPTVVHPDDKLIDDCTATVGLACRDCGWTVPPGDFTTEQALAGLRQIEAELQ